MTDTGPSAPGTLSRDAVPAVGSAGNPGAVSVAVHALRNGLPA